MNACFHPVLNITAYQMWHIPWLLPLYHSLFPIVRLGSALLSGKYLHAPFCHFPGQQRPTRICCTDVCGIGERWVQRITSVQCKQECREDPRRKAVGPWPFISENSVMHQPCVHSSCIHCEFPVLWRLTGAVSFFLGQKITNADQLLTRTEYNPLYQ